MVRFVRGGRGFVFRRGPWHLRPKSNDQIRPEMKLLGALAATAVPHPGLIAGCPDSGVLGAGVFYLMAPADGFTPTAARPSAPATPLLAALAASSGPRTPLVTIPRDDEL